LGFAVTEHPTAEWLARQITEAFPWDTSPRHLIPDNDRAFDGAFGCAPGIRDQPTWQNGQTERLIGSVRRKCTDHLIALNADDAPCTRLIELIGDVVAHPSLGRLHQPYARI
jgi:hypothetical protein